MHDLGRVLRERLPSLLVLFDNEAEYPLQLDERGLTRVHQCVAAPPTAGMSSTQEPSS